MNDHLFEQRFSVHVAPLETEVARSALEAAFGALGEALDPHGATAAAGGLPPCLREALLRGKGPRSLVPEDVYRHVAHHLGVDEARALELTQVVLEAVAAIVEPPAVERLRRELGAPLDALLRKQPSLPVATWELRRDRTLAGGRPGSAHSLADASRASGHSQSVANADNPHAERKLSSAHPYAASLEDDEDRRT